MLRCTGGRDDEECSDGLAGTSISHRLSANDCCCCCDDVRSQCAAKSPSSTRSRSGILKHSRTSSSFDISSSSASTSLKENGNCAGCYHLLSNSPSARGVAFFEPPISVYKWCLAVDFDSCQAMEKVRAVTDQLCPPAHDSNRKDERIVNYPLPATDQRRKSCVGLSSADALEAETSRVNPAIVYDNVNEFFSRMQDELVSALKLDEIIIVIYGFNIGNCLNGLPRNAHVMLGMGS